MSHDLFVGFEKEPEDLDGVLIQLGFQPDRDDFNFYEWRKSQNPIELSYVGKIEDPEFWSQIDPNIRFEAQITCRGGSQYDFDQHLKLAKRIRDHYTAVLVDAQLPESNIIKR